MNARGATIDGLNILEDKRTHGRNTNELHMAYSVSPYKYYMYAIDGRFVIGTQISSGRHASHGGRPRAYHNERREMLRLEAK